MARRERHPLPGSREKRLRAGQETRSMATDLYLLTAPWMATDWSINQSTEQSINQTINVSIKQSNNQWNTRSNNQRINQSICQRINQSINRLIHEGPIKQSIKVPDTNRTSTMKFLSLYSSVCSKLRARDIQQLRGGHFHAVESNSGRHKKTGMSGSDDRGPLYVALFFGTKKPRDFSTQKKCHKSPL